LPYASEGGHADFPAYNTFEHELTAFIQEREQFDCPVSWEHVLSGKGIKRIYDFLGTKKSYQETEVAQIIANDRLNPDKISQYAQDDPQCRDTFSMYARFYARCAKCLALDMLALNGIYIGGGIAAKNIDIFQDEDFINEFTRCGAHSALLKRIPIYVIADYNVSLYGAAGFQLLYDRNIL
jgi:glucokinase